jgi:hypothetical protein
MRICGTIWRSSNLTCTHGYTKYELRITTNTTQNIVVGALRAPTNYFLIGLKR